MCHAPIVSHFYSYFFFLQLPFDPGFLPGVDSYPVQQRLDFFLAPPVVFVGILNSSLEMPVLMQKAEQATRFTKSEICRAFSGQGSAEVFPTTIH
jgi:hypothetical protein